MGQRKAYFVTFVCKEQTDEWINSIYSVREKNHQYKQLEKHVLHRDQEASRAEYEEHEENA